MKFLKELFKDNAVVGLCGLRKRNEYVFIDIPKEYKNTYMPNTEKNYLLI